jgi:hypothetical protein
MGGAGPGDRAHSQHGCGWPAMADVALYRPVTVSAVSSLLIRPVGLLRLAARTTNTPTTGARWLTGVVCWRVLACAGWFTRGGWHWMQTRQLVEGGVVCLHVYALGQGRAHVVLAARSAPAARRVMHSTSSARSGGREETGERELGTFARAQCRSANGCASLFLHGVTGTVFGIAQ